MPAFQPASRIRKIAVVALVLLLSAGLAAAQDEERWFHIRVSDGSADPVKVAVNLPLSLLEAALAVIPSEVNAEVEMELHDIGVQLEDLRAFWEKARNTNDATFVTVESDDETVNVFKEGDYLIARTVESREGGAQVDVRLPFDVLTAMFSNDETVDLAAAVRAIAQHSEGDLVTVREGDTRVRIWVDDVNEPTDA